jgi:hypothetical protein
MEKVFRTWGDKGSGLRREGSSMAVSPRNSGVMPGYHSFEIYTLEGE